VGKCLAAVLPAVLATWLGTGVYYAGAAILAPGALPALAAPHWMLAILVLGPLIALFSVQVAMMISSRVEDPRTAQQVSGLIVLPLVLLLAGQSIGLFILSTTLVLAATLAMLPICAFTTWMAVQLFEREHILTRWK
jgi:ABC-2 type transport system permease protein